MSDLTARLRAMRTNNGQSLHELMCESADESERLAKALKRLYQVALNYLPAEREVGEAVEEACNVLAAAGDGDAISANREWEHESARLRISA